MQVSNPNNVKIYNIGAGKSQPEWLTDKKKKSVLKSNVDIQRRVELLQDFEMPTCSTSIRFSADRRYILATGTYKPRVRCYDVNQKSMKFERCMDADIVKFLLLSEDYSKPVFLQNDRFVEFHSQHGRYYRFRLPTYGRDLALHPASAELYFVGVGPDVFIFNLQKGMFVKGLKTDASEVNCCEFNRFHGLFLCGTKEGQVECWDPRKKTRVGILDCTQHIESDNRDVKKLPSITTLKYQDATNFAVGTSTGQVLLYDMRTTKPRYIKDHNYGLPIRDVEFHTENLVLSCDTRILKIWNQQTGAPFTSIEPETAINGLCVIPDSGLLFLANEAPKILSYYIPELGSAPQWAGVLDALTEELEESAPQVYDDYKFVTRPELDSLGLSDLIGTNLVRAEMHGFYMDIRLYLKTKAIVEPFTYTDFKKKIIEEKRAVENRVKVKKLPTVNRNLAEKLIELEADTNVKKKAKKETASNLLHDSRFGEMFTDSAFQVNEQSEEYIQLNPLVSKLDRERKKRQEQERMEIDGEKEDNDSGDESSDDEHTYRAEDKAQLKKRAQEKYMRQKEENQRLKLETEAMKIRYIQGGGDQRKGAVSDGSMKKIKTDAKKSLGERVDEEDDGVVNLTGSTYGNIEMSYKVKPKTHPFAKQRDDENRNHLKERRKEKRSTSSIEVPKYQRGMLSKRGRR